jgi:hypothetical protein
MTLLFCLVLAGAAAASPQQNGAPRGPSASGSAAPEIQEESTPEPGAGLPVSLARIQRALTRVPVIRLKGDRNVYRIEVIGRKPTIEDILGEDYLKGPTPSGAMTHQEFLSIVTPKAVQGYAAFSNREAITVAATSIALKWALQKAIHKYETAKEEREREAARREVQDALAELERARRKAGLPPK